MAGEWDIVSTQDAPTLAGNPVTGMPIEPANGWSVVSEHPMAGPSGSLLTDAGRFAGTAATNALAAPLALPHLAAEGVDWLAGKAGFKPGAAEALGGIKAPGGNQPLFPDYQTARDMAFNTTGATEYQPQTWLGRRGMDAATGVMGAPFGGGLRAIPALAGGSATAGAAAEAFPDHPLVAAMLGFIPGAAVGKGLANVPMRLSSAMSGGARTEPYAAFERLGLPRNLAGTTTGEPGLLYAEKLASRLPGSEAAMGNARNDLVQGWQAKLDDTARTLGTAVSPQEAGTTLQASAGQWVKDFKGLTGQMWNRFHTMVPSATPVPVSNYETTLNGLMGNFSGAPKTGEILRPSTVKALSDALGVDLQAGQTLPWEAVKSIRTSIGEKLETPSIIADTSQSALKQIYKALSQDMEAGAANVSPQALAAFKQANNATSAGHAFIDDHLHGVLNATNPEQALQNAMSQSRLGGSRLQALGANLPGAAMGDVGAVALRNMATNTESPTALAQALLGRKPTLSQEAQNVLFPQAVRQQISDLGLTGRAMMPVEKDLMNSPTATHTMRGPARLITAVEMARQGHGLAGTPGAVAGAGLGLMAPTLAGKAAQMTALNPMMARLFGSQMPVQLTGASPLARALLPAAIANDPYQALLATSPNSGRPQ